MKKIAFSIDPYTRFDEVKITNVVRGICCQCKHMCPPHGFGTHNNLLMSYATCMWKRGEDIPSCMSGEIALKVIREQYSLFVIPCFPVIAGEAHTLIEIVDCPCFSFDEESIKDLTKVENIYCENGNK